MKTLLVLLLAFALRADDDAVRKAIEADWSATVVVFPEAADEGSAFRKEMLAIRQEIQAVADGRADRRDNVLKNAPHTAEDTTADEWTHPYSRQQAVYPVPGLRHRKFWPPVSRIDNPYGDRNLVCACPPVEEYEQV